VARDRSDRPARTDVSGGVAEPTQSRDIQRRIGAVIAEKHRRIVRPRRTGEAASSREPSLRDRYDSRPIPDRAPVIFTAALAAALVLGYLFLNKLVDISREEDCMLSRNKNCAATELPGR
jgi:hypothetical protein